jgi:hypothetical protein
VRVISTPHRQVGIIPTCKIFAIPYCKNVFVAYNPTTK